MVFVGITDLDDRTGTNGAIGSFGTPARHSPPTWYKDGAVKRLTIILAALVLADLSLSAQAGHTEEYSEAWQHRLAVYEQRVQSLEQQLLAVTAANQGTPCEEFCEAGCENYCPGWFASVDYLNWQVERDDLGFAIIDPAGLGVPSAGQPVRSLGLGPDSGFRTALGRRGPDGWEFGVRYTHFRTDESVRLAPGGGQILAVQSSPATGLTNADSVTATSNFRYDVFDVEAGHWFDPSDTLSVLVTGGLRFATIDHRLRGSLRRRRIRRRLGRRTNGRRFDWWPSRIGTAL